MTPGVKPLVAGNWKMNGSCASQSMVEAIVAGYGPDLQAKADLAIFPPSILLWLVGTWLDDTPIIVGAQDCHAEASGAHTGDTSAKMIKDAGGTHAIVGHSERRTDHGETSAIVCGKAQAAIDTGLTTIICIGETQSERESGQTLDVLGTQLAGSVPDSSTSVNTVIAYEPVWAIGTGLVPDADDVKEAHQFIRDTLVARFGVDGGKFRLQYGGSVKPSNAAELMSIANVDGALIGGASLNADDFLSICAVYGALNG